MLRSRRRAITFGVIFAISVSAVAYFETDIRHRKRFFAELTNYSMRPPSYIPGRGTSVGYYGSKPGLNVAGTLDHDILIAQNEGRRLTRLSKSGSVLWTIETPGAVRGMEVVGNTIFLAARVRLLAVDLATGDILWTRRVESKIAGFGVSGRDLFFLTVDHKYRFRSLPLDTGQHPETRIRDVDMLGDLHFARHLAFGHGLIVIADTFNHRVLVLDEDGETRAAIETYFPNYIEILGPDRILIAEEHANRILDWNPVDDSRNVLVACPHPLFQSVEATPADIVAQEAETLAPSLFSRRSICDDRVNEMAIYSPNGFDYVSADTLYVADTDNHRVVLVDPETKSIRATISGANNPIRVRAIGVQD